MSPLVEAKLSRLLAEVSGSNPKDSVLAYGCNSFFRGDFGGGIKCQAVGICRQSSGTTTRFGGIY